MVSIRSLSPQRITARNTEFPTLLKKQIYIYIGEKMNACERERMTCPEEKKKTKKTRNLQKINHL